MASATGASFSRLGSPYAIVPSATCTTGYISLVRVLVTVRKVNDRPLFYSELYSAKFVRLSIHIIFVHLLLRSIYRLQVKFRALPCSKIDCVRPLLRRLRLHRFVLKESLYDKHSNFQKVSTEYAE